MQAILHVSNTATQERVDHLNQIFSLSEPLIKEAVSDILQRNGHSIADPTLSEVVAVMDCNVLSTSTSKGAEFSSSKCRNLYWVQLSLYNASGVSVGATWSYQCVCSYPLNEKTFSTRLLNQILHLVNMHHALMALISLKMSYCQQVISSYHSSYILMILKLLIRLAHHAKFTNFALYIRSSLMCRQNTHQHYMLYS